MPAAVISFASIGKGLLGLACVSVGLGCGPRMKRDTVEARTYSSRSECWQGPLEAEFTGRGAKWGESIEIRACSPAGINASAMVEVDGVWRNSGPVGFGDKNNERCTLGRSIGVGGDGDGAGPGPAGKVSGGGGPRASAATDGSSHFAISNSTSGDVCFSTTSTSLPLTDVEKGARIRVVLWAQAPNDITAGYFQIRHVVNKPNVSDAEWEAHIEKKRKKYALVDEDGNGISQAELDDLLARSEEREKERTAERAQSRPTTPPPSARLESPASPPYRDAEWMPGYWEWHGEWAWIRGRWRAPSAAPTARGEERPAAPTAGVWIWSPGYWSWNGRAFIWIGGAWLE